MTDPEIHPRLLEVADTIRLGFLALVAAGSTEDQALRYLAYVTTRRNNLMEESRDHRDN